MLIKWIVCDVPDASIEDFSSAQQAWAPLADAAGFIAQFGGYDANRAHIFSIWKDDVAYKRFMSLIHDRILRKNLQHHFYTSIKVELYATAFDTEASIAKLADICGIATHLKLTTGTLRDDAEESAVESQWSAWLADISRAPRALQSTFSGSLIDPNRYLITTLLCDAAPESSETDDATCASADTISPSAQDGDTVTTAITEKTFELVPSWSLTRP